MEETTITRKQKVNYLHPEDTWQRFKRYPMIRIAGKYLRDFNFNIGDNLEINLSIIEIVIRKPSEDFPAKI
jgi:hypothetical protein